MKMVDARSGIEIIERGECLRLLAGEEVGRVGVVAGGTAHVVPVNYALDGESIVFRTGPGTKLLGALRTTVSFEVDHIERATRSGWSVIVRGLAREVSAFDHPDVQERLWSLPLEPWGGGDRGHLVRIAGTAITGRRIPPPSPATPPPRPA